MEENVDILVEIARGTLSLMLSLLELAMFLRAIMSWFVMEGNRVTDFLYAITEPVIFPVRILFNKMNWATELPIDIPFMITFLLLSVINIFI